MTVRYFYAPGTCSLAGMAALEMTEAPYEPCLVEMAGPRTELRAVSPLGKVPALATAERVVTDTVAIIFGLSRRHPEARLLPAADDEMAAALSVMAWLGSTLHIVRRQYARAMAFTPDPAAQKTVRDAAAPLYWSELQRLDRWVAEQESAGPLHWPGVQVYAMVFYQWALTDGLPAAELRHLAALVDRLKARPAVVRALERHASPLLGSKA